MPPPACSNQGNRHGPVIPSYGEDSSGGIFRIYFDIGFLSGLCGKCRDVLFVADWIRRRNKIFAFRAKDAKQAADIFGLRACDQSVGCLPRSCE